MRYKSICTVMKVEERFTRRHQRGHGDKAEFIDESMGWWAVLPGNVALHLGAEKPDIIPGQMAMLILETACEGEQK